MNTARLKALFAKNKVILAVAGAAAVGLFAWVNRGEASASSSDTSSYSSGAQAGTATGGVYDSSSSDVYNALQPQLETIGDRLDAFQTWLATNGKPTTTTTTPVPATPVPATTKVPLLSNPGISVTVPKATYKPFVPGGRLDTIQPVLPRGRASA